MRPPASVVVVVALTYIAGVADIIGGILVILLRYTDDVERIGGQVIISVFGAAIVLFGLFAIALASGLYRGRHGARVAVTVVMAVSCVAALIATFDGADGVVTSIVEVALPAAVVAALWVGPARRFFAGK
jgi:hypothetical protein